LSRGNFISERLAHRSDFANEWPFQKFTFGRNDMGGTAAGAPRLCRDLGGHPGTPLRHRAALQKRAAPIFRFTIISVARADACH
jgi:hypothetical protein